MDNARSCSEVFKQEFQKKYWCFGGVSDKPRVFGRAQCGRISVLYIVYRIIVAAFWMIIQMLTHQTFRSYTHWTIWIGALVAISSYLQLISSLYSLYLYYKTENMKEGEEPSIGNVTKSKSEALVLEQESLMGTSTSVSGQQKTSKIMSVFYAVDWIFYYLAFDGSLMVMLCYWTLLYDGSQNTVMNYIMHAGNGVYVVTDMFITGVPFRILHFYIICLLELAYWLMSLILCWTDVTCSLYPFLDYTHHPAIAFLFTFGAIFIAAPAMHMIGFCLYRLRVRLYSGEICCRKHDTKIKAKVN